MKFSSTLRTISSTFKLADMGEDDLSSSPGWDDAVQKRYVVQLQVA